jgi:trimethylamine--corrinoid protein Co-methyltransferase
MGITGNKTMTIASSFRLVDKNTLENIHEATLDILSHTGIVFQSQECLKIFKNHGARVQGETVFIPPDMVEKAIASAPNTFQWEGRNPENNIVVGKGQEGIHVSLNNGPIYIQDQDNGRRLGTKADLINLYKLAQHSKVCNINGQIPVEPSDVTHPLRYLDIFRQLLIHTDKPLFGYVGTQKEVGQMFDMIKISMGGGDDVLEKKRIGVSLNPLSPLRYDEIPCETLLAYAKHGQPIMVLVCAMAGVTAPVNPMGTVTLQNAEILAGLVLSQLINPGTPFIYSPASAIPNMRTAAYVTGSPQSTLINMVGIQLARELYDIPSRCMAGLTDAKEVDCQAGYETMQNYLMLAMAGVNMVNECYGILDAIMTVSYEKFIIDDEIMARAALATGGINNFDADYSKKMIQDMGHGGSYLMHPSTMQQCRNFWTPSVSTSDSYDDWQKKGGKDVVTRANETYKEILSQCPDKMVSDDIDQDLERYIEDQRA